MIDAEDGFLGEHLTDNGIELACALEVVPEGLLDHHAAPRAVAFRGQTRTRQLPAHHGEGVRGDRQVERVVAARTAFAVELLEGRREFRERRIVVEGALHEADPLREALPDLLAEGGTRVLTHRVVDHLTEILVGPVPPGETDERESGRQEAAVGEVVDGGHQLAPGQIAGHAEDHQRARAGDTGQSAISVVPERVHPLRRTGFGHVQPSAPGA